jgi:dipeptidyl aminopeptidase/acylaminoacyl peptidase
LITLRGALGLALCLCFAAQNTAQAQAIAAKATDPIPVEAFFDRPVFSGAQLSPNAKFVAYRYRAPESRVNLAVMDLTTMSPKVVASFKDADVRRFRWVNDKRLVFDLSPDLKSLGRVDFLPGLFAVNADGDDFKGLVETTPTFFKDASMGRELLRWNTFLLGSLGKQANSEVVVVSPEEYGLRKDWGHNHLLRLNTMTGRAVEFDDVPPTSQDWLLDAQGELRAMVTVKDHKVTVSYREAGGAWQNIADYDWLEGRVIWPAAITPDGRLLVSASSGQDTQALYAWDFVNKRLADKPIASAPGFDISAELISNDKQLLGWRYTIDAEVTQWIDPAMKELQALLDRSLKDTVNRISVGRRPETDFVLVESWSDKQPSVYRVFDTKAKKLVRIGQMHPNIDAKRMGATDFVRFKARDGLEIPLWVTVPAGSTGKNLPTVVLVHGGPFVRGTHWGWDGEVQFLASRGYAVIQPEFRGSKGYGSKLYRAGWKQWGLAMQDDVADATRWAIAQGIADPKRIAIAGASYGGYATLMGLVRDPDLYRCGINWVGVTDLNLLFDVDWSDMSDDFLRYGLPKLVGDKVKDAEQFKATSPIAQAARITQPLLLAYGAWDQRVPIIHGEKFRDAVKAHNSKVEWVVYPDEAHGWAKPETRYDFWRRVETFLARNLAAAP